MNLNETSSVSGRCEVRRVVARDEGEAVSAFLLQPGLFGTPLTPGERDEFSTQPVASVGCPDDAYWFARDGDMAPCAVIGVRMNAERTGIYEVSALAIHPAHRRRGLGRRLLKLALRFVADSGGRGLLFETSSDLSYAPMHRILAELGFKQVGCFPDFYYPGEDTLWYYRPVDR
ncbi:MAG TPA: GNAT family N-acetyltransferase [Kiritimatiellia bacterium]|nr:GNAT family N-acetyltransferase [Kiritimatiellia bacterium]HSA18782.1 GNAT family N-acetyltransferase [Kiritimatiellia bacterium]